MTKHICYGVVRILSVRRLIFVTVLLLLDYWNKFTLWTKFTRLEVHLIRHLLLVMIINQLGLFVLLTFVFGPLAVFLCMLIVVTLVVIRLIKLRLLLQVHLLRVLLLHLLVLKALIVIVVLLHLLLLLHLNIIELFCCVWVHEKLLLT